MLGTANIVLLAPQCAREATGGWHGVKHASARGEGE